MTTDERDKLAKRLRAQRRKINKTLRLFGRQLSAHLADLEELVAAPPPAKPRKPAAILAADEADRLIREANKRR